MDAAQQEQQKEEHSTAEAEGTAVIEEGVNWSLHGAFGAGDLQ